HWPLQGFIRGAGEQPVAAPCCALLRRSFAVPLAAGLRRSTRRGLHRPAPRSASARARRLIVGKVLLDREGAKVLYLRHDVQPPSRGYASTWCSHGGSGRRRGFVGNGLRRDGVIVPTLGGHQMSGHAGEEVGGIRPVHSHRLPPLRGEDGPDETLDELE